MNWHIVSWVFLVALLQDGTATPTTEPLLKPAPDKFESDWPVGDPRRCQEELRQDKFKIKRFEVMPGIGWDNLRNIEGGLVVSYNFTQCKATDDGRLLIPDNVFTVPIKFSSVETFAELFDHWLNASSTTSNTVNIQAGLSTSSVAVSGGFSYEHEQVKSKQIEDKAVTTRVQLRYTRYEAKLQPDPVLSPQFKNRLLSIAANVQLNYTEQARYEAQLLIRDFGTHVLTSVTAGAALVKDDYLQRQYVLEHTEQKTSILASASASFFKLVHVSASFGHKTDKSVDDTYESLTTHSYTKSHGGPLFKPGNMTLDDWANGVDDNLVPIDRSGDPLYFLITPTLFPELPSTTVAEVEKLVKESIELYYEMNTFRGCTKLGAPNFSFSANFDDGSCHAKPTNLTFGGVFQQCTINGQYLNMNPCEGLDVVNPKTGGMSCPPSFTAVELQSERINGHIEARKECHRCHGLLKCCHIAQYYSEAVYSTYWCAATGPVAPESGYLFGGLYTSTTDNVVTGTQGCPASFYARQMFTDLQLCISDDYEFGQPFSVPFGGFFSCKSGNPLAADGVHPVGANRAGASNSLRSFMAKSGKSWPSKCPQGYSQHLATDDMGCSIHYCVQTGALTGPALPQVKRPPFMKKPPAVLEPDNLVIFSREETRAWMKNEKARVFESALTAEISKQNNNSGKEMSPGVAAAISVVATLVCVGIIILIIVAVRKRKSKQQGPYRRLTDETFEELANYGSTRPESGVVINETA